MPSSRLKTQLLAAGLQKTNNALYQVINQLIDEVLRVEISGTSGSRSAGPKGEKGDAGPMTPYFIASDETFVVPEFDQSLFAMNIDNEGILEVNGFLIEVE